MTFGSIGRFPDLRPTWSHPESRAEVHGTTVIALRHQGGVTLVGDRRATMGNLIMYDRAEKIVPIDPCVVLAVSGAYARSLEVCRYLRHSIKYYERLNRVSLSTEAKLAEVSRALGSSLAASEAVGLFLPIAATYDPKSQEFGVHFFDAAGARFEGASYACAGSGSERIRGVFEYVARTQGPWERRSAEEVLVDAVRLLDLAADMDAATGGVRRIVPSAYRLTPDGPLRIGDAELERAAAKAMTGQA